MILPDIVTNYNCTAEHYVYGNGNNGSTVEFYKIIEGDHSWPGAFININTTNMDFDASQEIWRFLHQFKLDNLTHTIELISEPTFLIYPNPSNDISVLHFNHSGKRNIVVTDLLGSVVYDKFTTELRVELDIDTPGTYLITVCEGKSIQTQRLVQF